MWTFPKINYPGLELFTKLWWFSSGAWLSNTAYCWMELHVLACMSSRVMPKSSIFLTAFGIYFLMTHLLPSAMSVALIAFRNSLLQNCSFSPWNLLVFSVTHCMEDMSKFSNFSVAPFALTFQLEVCLLPI